MYNVIKKKMKKVLLCLVGAGMMINISAQEIQAPTSQKHEVYAGFGLLNDNQMIALIGDAIKTAFTLGYLVEPGEYKALTPFVGYRYNFTNRFSLGGMFAYDVNSVYVAKETADGKLDTKDKREVKRRYMTYAIEPKFNYIAKPAFQLYGYFGLGVTVINFASVKFNNGDEPKVESRVPVINGHLTPVGARFGKKFGGFVEIGYGYKGILNAGFSYLF